MSLKPPETSFWKGTLHGGVRDGLSFALHGPYPRVKVPEGEYRRVSYDREAMTASYEWAEESKPAKGPSSQGDGLGAPLAT